MMQNVFECIFDDLLKNIVSSQIQAASFSKSEIKQFDTK